jgi:hypothetical protein
MKKELRVKRGYYSHFFDKPLFIMFFHLLHGLPRGDLPWRSPHNFCLHFLFPVILSLLLYITSYLQYCWYSPRSTSPTFSCGNPLGVKILFCAFCSNVGLTCILLSISLSSAASCVTYGTVTKSPFYTVYRFLVTFLLTQRIEQWA